MTLPSERSDNHQLADLSPFDELGLDNLAFDELFWSCSASNVLEHEHEHELAAFDGGMYTQRSDAHDELRLEQGRASPSSLMDWQDSSIQPRRSPVNGPSGPLEILICCGNAQTQTKLERMLAALGCRAIVAGTQQRALQYLSNGVSFDLVVVGLEHQDHNLAESMRAVHPGNQDMPVLAITAGLQGFEELRDFDLILELPLNKPKLEDAINLFYACDRTPNLASREDPGSDCSWTAADDDEEWQFAFKGHLRRFQAQNERVSLMTPPLVSKQRRKIHAMAHLYRLSHTSLGCGKYKRILILKCQLLKPSSTLNHWNPGRSQWAEGVVDPRIIAFEGVACNTSTEVVTAWLEQACLPSPSLISHDGGKAEPTRISMHMLFEHPSDAAIVLEAVHGTIPSWTTSAVTCDYTVFKDCFWSPWQIPTDFDTVLSQKMDTTTASSIRTRPKIESRSSSVVLSSDDDTSSESDFSDINTYAKSTNSSRYSAPTTNPSTVSFSTSSASRSQHKGKHKMADTTSLHSFATTVSSLPTIADDQASDNNTNTPSTHSNNRKRRLPYSPSGYQCSFPSCTKTFDHAGDCRKHEKIHEDRSHVCEICGKTFLYPKDVRRHCQNVHKWKETFMAQRAERKVRPS